MSKGICRLFKIVLVVLLSVAVSMAAEPFPQDPQQPAQTEPSRPADDSQQALARDSGTGATANTPLAELPDARSSAAPVQQKQNDSAAQTQNPAAVPSGTAGAKAAPAKGAPASRRVGSAIAPAKQRERRSLLIKMGLVAGACVAVGTAVALSKGSPSRPPGAP